MVNLGLDETETDGRSLNILFTNLGSKFGYFALVKFIRI